MQNKKHIAKHVISVADAVAMNTLPEYWLSLKLAGMHVISLLSVARSIFHPGDINH